MKLSKLPAPQLCQKESLFASIWRGSAFLTTDYAPIMVPPKVQTFSLKECYTALPAVAYTERYLAAFS